MTGATMPAGRPVHAIDTMHVVARVGSERFAFRVADVEEVLDAPELVAVPAAPAGLAGQLPHRSHTVRAYDAAWAFGIARSGTATTALVLRVADDRVALLVDDVEDLAALDAADMRPAPAGTDPAGVLRGVCLPRAAGVAPKTHAARGDSSALIGVVNAVAIVARASSLRGVAGPASSTAGGSQ